MSHVHDYLRRSPHLPPMASLPRFDPNLVQEGSVLYSPHTETLHRVSHARTFLDLGYYTEDITYLRMIDSLYVTFCDSTNSGIFYSVHTIDASGFLIVPPEFYSLLRNFTDDPAFFSFSDDPSSPSIFL